MEDYEKDSYIWLGSAIVVIALVSLFRYFSFDNTVLKYVNMEPFSEPIQETIENGKVFQHKTAQGDAYITPIAKYKLYGRVYDHHFRPSKLYGAAVEPYDISIGFGDFQYKDVYRAVSVKMASTVSYLQWNRKYFDVIETYFKTENSWQHYFTNNHLCPANKNVKKGISKLRKKDVVYIEGYLIKYKHYRKDGRTEEGISSTSRDDSFGGDNGNGNCEQIYVTRVVSRHGDFR
ncbi:MAG: hypothetical protein NC408_09255 [Candidatus Gastranaerophilales bacterium]|nr:hypothetical protein [Candidatus Gastranaerophilales bacterium]MCM1073743.1 hypothetical protein [Bacteroides sp.]